ncbi:MAG: type I restriction enzyme HsdR N-terminal domain-containing protein [Chitinophagaceae bacterium]|nr:type I restriction enzyme HsdR N-terminal domain-containing protein [Chitinophagaceae bacterium]
MIKIDYPPYQPKIKKEGNNEFIFDEIRKRWIVLTPEEWVRQNFLQYLIQIKKYPASLIAIEKEIIVNNLKKRFDVVVYDTNTKPWMLIECKEMNVDLTEKVLNQILRYHSSLQTPFLVITNGLYCIAYQNANGQLKPLLQIPSVS